MINAQHAHIYRIHTLHFIFGEIFFPKILSIQPLIPPAKFALDLGILGRLDGVEMMPLQKV
jgi:hypothetical protein